MKSKPKFLIIEGDGEKRYAYSFETGKFYKKMYKTNQKLNVSVTLFGSLLTSLIYNFFDHLHSDLGAPSILGILTLGTFVFCFIVALLVIFASKRFVHPEAF
ncbi:hypothetical protein [Lactococcus termiticola]|uniref:Uncharacterized protein n=1 Tax=Lactococcus termiticola TaxID=2169526 RepID=A0A2R5HFN2_9LACT|nr:hypothetical protein [Lactococcus termiticola]GBG96834.1 hypothetical protein NtB2_00959 [Lactococcus termiticola]